MSRTGARAPSVIWEQSVPCPKCRAPVGSYCRAANGLVRNYVHMDRLKANKTPCPIAANLTYVRGIAILPLDSIPA